MNTNAAELSETDIWSFVPVGDFKVPSSPAGEVTRGLLVQTWRSMLTAIHRLNRDKSNAKTDFRRPSADVLRRLSPSFGEERAEAFATAVGDEWLSTIHPEKHLRTFIAPPGCELGAVLSAFARKRRFKTIEGPLAILDMADSEVEAILAGVKSGEDILVIPRLEQFFLRHQKGLSLIRRLAAEFSAGSRRVLVGCDSWSWAFLKEAIGIEDALGEPLTFAAFDAHRLDAWFRATINVSENEIHQRGSDDLVFSDTSGGRTGDTPSKPEVSMLLRSLASHSRGNPGVASALWREGLRMDPRPANAAEESGVKPPGSLWALPLTSSNDSGHCIEHTDRFILHAVLLHGGLPQKTIMSLLPFSRDEVVSRVTMMKNSGILVEHVDLMRVSCAAYPKVRQELSGEGFLTDAF